jgi:hypothetical protein
MLRNARSQQVAYRYLYGFRRTVPPLAALGGVVAWQADWTALAAGLLCIALGELLETSYYINVLRWAEQARKHSHTDTDPCTSSPKPTV